MGERSKLQTNYCTYCGVRFFGAPEFTIHRDGSDFGPQVPLCRRCGSEDGPSCEEIWVRIAEDRRLVPQYAVSLN